MGRDFYQQWIRAFADASVPQYGSYQVIDRIMRRYFPPMTSPVKFRFFGVYKQKEVHIQDSVSQHGADIVRYFSARYDTCPDDRE